MILKTLKNTHKNDYIFSKYVVSHLGGTPADTPNLKRKYTLFGINQSCLGQEFFDIKKHKYLNLLHYFMIALFNVIGKYKKEKARLKAFCNSRNMVEAGGIEPPSEDGPCEATTILVCALLPNPRRPQTHYLGRAYGKNLNSRGPQNAHRADLSN